MSKRLFVNDVSETHNCGVAFDTRTGNGERRNAQSCVSAIFILNLSALHLNTSETPWPFLSKLTKNLNYFI
ncbi:MAG: hypothetical protein VB105_12225 [Paludibacter sp.]|nr:hypothetical protein [Paludibacter sp.]